MQPFPLLSYLRAEELVVTAELHLCAHQACNPKWPSHFSVYQSQSLPRYIFFFFFLILFLCYKTCLFDVLKKFERGEKRQVTYIQESDKASIIGEGLLIEWEMRNEGMEDVVILFELCILFLPKW